MSIFLDHYHHDFHFPPSNEPAWAGNISRWHQMDAASFGLTDAFLSFKNKMGRPSLIILASPLASNESDFNFVQTGAINPTKMIHTLPNVRVHSLLNLLEWSGPTLCIQKDPQSIQAGLAEAFSFVSKNCPVVWVVSVFENAGTHAVDFFVLRSEQAVIQDALNTAYFLGHHPSGGATEKSDQEFLAFLSSNLDLKKEGFALPDPLKLLSLPLSFPVSSTRLGAYVPHRPPMLWIHQVLWVTPNQGACLAQPQNLGHAWDEQGLRASSAVEWMAQASGFIKTCQHLNFKEQKIKETKNAYLVSVRNIELIKDFSQKASRQSQLIISIQTIRDLEPFSIIRAQVKTEVGEILAQGELKVFIE